VVPWVVVLWVVVLWVVVPWVVEEEAWGLAMIWQT